MRKSANEICRLLPMQEGMLFHSLSALISGVYVGQLVARLQKDIDLCALERAWQGVVDRHQALRTTFHWDRVTEPVQQVHSGVRLNIEVHDWRDVSVEKEREALDAYLLNDQVRGFDLSTPPLMRFSLLQLPQGEHFLVWTHHHALLDGRARVIVLKEVARLYDAFRRGETPNLAAPPLYRDYVEWFYSQERSGEEEYWGGLLQTFTSPVSVSFLETKLPLDGKRFRTREIFLPSDLKNSLQTIARKNKVTANIIIQATWAALLSKYSGQEDIVFGETRACRRPDFEGIGSLVGVLMNTLPVRLDTSPPRSFSVLLADLRNQHVSLRDHEHSSLSDIRKWSGVSNKAQLFESIVVFEEYELNAALKHDGCSLWSNGVYRTMPTHYPLTLVGYGKPDLFLSITYDGLSVSDAAAERIARHFQTLLQSALAMPDAPLARLPLISAPERNQLLLLGNKPESLDHQYPRSRCVHQLFEQQVQIAPLATALLTETQSWSYAGLNAQANQWARLLLARGLTQHDRVAVCLPRSPQTIVLFLAILKAGAAYVPLDPEDPPARLRLLLHEAQPSLLLTLSDLFPSELQDFSVPVLYVDQAVQDATLRDTANLLVSTDPSRLAYLMYTSGSSGTPKAVAVPHRAIVRLLMATDYVQFGPRNTILQLAPLGFDASTFEIWGALLHGARLVLYQENKPNLERLAAMLSRFDVNCLWLTTSLFNLIIDTHPEMLVGVRQLLTGGEALSVPHIDRALHLLPDTTLINGYGPTEGTTFTCAQTIPRPRPQTWASIPLGQPIAHTQVFILDPQGEPTPIGVAGELFIGGDGLAREYFNAPRRTAASFVPHPFARHPGERLYASGDLACWREDGSIAFLGRRDQQVKIRGFRIELAEIEACLRQQPGIRDAVVVLHQPTAADKRLIAYVVPQSESISMADVLSHLRQALPEYMLPSALVPLPALPLTPNGKLDRRALPQPSFQPVSQPTYVPPRTPTEELLAGIWAEVLSLPRVGIHDDFFFLGGHSLLAMQAVSRIRDLLHVEITLRDLFEASTVAALAEYLSTGYGVGTPQLSPRLVPGERTAALPLSFAQQRLWFLDHFESHSTYNIPIVLRLNGTLQVHVLQQALNHIVERHEVLRTTFQQSNGQPVQVVHSECQVAVPLVDAHPLAGQLQKEMVQSLLQEQFQAPFDLSRGPLLRFLLLRLQPTEHLLVMTMHHIVSDGWSLGIFTRELAQLYQAFGHGQPSPLPPLPIQYADYALWQREWLQGALLQEQLEYWKKQLLPLPPALELPIAMPRPATQSHRGAQHRFQWPQPLLEQVHALSHKQGATVFMTLLAAFQVLLYRYTDQSDLAVGTPLAGRNRRETEGLIGFFVNTLVLRTDLSGNPTFRQLLQRVRETALQAYNHQDVPFEKLVEELQPERDLSRSPLFQVMFALHNVPKSEWELAGLKLQPEPLPGAQAKFDLSLALEESPAGLHGTLVYAADLFPENAMRRMISHFECLLNGILAQPDAAISQLPILSAQEHSQLVHGWNATTRNYSPNETIHGLFERQAQRTPEAVALMHQGCQLSYEELDRQTNQLAHHLKMLGVGAEVPVGICLPRSTMMVVSMLAVLKAGGAYVPMDPDYPGERLRYMLEDARIAILLTQQELLLQLPACTQTTVCLDRDWNTIIEQSCGPCTAQVSPTNLAYVIYTSGSTGRPKGTAITHAAAVNLLHWAAEIFAAHEFAGLLFSTSICFDLSIFELFAPLSRGGAVILAGNALELPDLHEAERVRLVNTVPSVMAELLRTGSIPAGVRTVNLAGEPLPESLVKEIYQRTNVERIFNLYGPTEDTTYSTFAALERGCDSDVTIGIPIANTQTYILDHEMQPLPIGVTGELYIGGAGLARGYWQRPALTAERFVPNPFARVAGERLYRTGDRTRYREDGNLEYLGRLDQQVKIRGFRIELGEIESVLASHPSVAQGVMVAQPSPEGEKCLVAYLVSKPDAAGLSNASLLTFLEEHLPQYMLPSDLVILESLPLTPNGKVDRRKLSLLSGVPRPREEEYCPPQTPAQELLAGIWADILKAPRVGITDNFFHIGGHSLLAMQVVSRIRELLAVNVPVRQLFETPTIEALAKNIEQEKHQGQSRPFPRLVPGERTAALPLSFAQQRLWFLDHFESHSTYNIPIVLRLNGTLQVRVLQQALNHIVERHEVLRTTFEQSNGQPVQVIHSECHVAVPLVDAHLLAGQLQKEMVQSLLQEQFQAPFDLSRGPLLRFLLLRLQPTEHLLVMTMHHIVSDGWSLGIFTRELAHLYQAFGHGQPSPLPPLPIQYADYALWQREWLQGALLHQQLEYWKKQLLPLPPALELPIAMPRPATQSHRGAQHRFQWPHPLLEQVHALSRKQGATVFMTLLAAFQVLLYRYTDQSDLAVGTPLAGRNRRETEGLIGFFVNTLVLRTDLSGNPSFRQLLQRVRETALQAYNHQDVPFEKLVEELQPERDLSRSPLFQVMFALHNVPKSEWELAGLKLQPEPLPGAQAKFDLSLALEESPAGLHGTLVYAADLFPEHAMRRMISHFECLLNGILAQPDAAISQLPILSAQEHSQLVHGWNATTRNYSPNETIHGVGNKLEPLDHQYPRSRCVHQLFEQQAQLAPLATALLTETQSWSYTDLNAQANQWARLLLAHGLTQDDRVAACLPRSPQTIVLFLAILKAGAAYVPLDPEDPPSRLRLLLHEAQPSLLLTLSDLFPSELQDFPVPVLYVDQAAQDATLQDTANLLVSTDSSRLAYLMYTSGSSGTPKAVAVPHRAIVRLLMATDYVQLGPHNTIPQLAPLGFDASTFEIWGALLHGARLVLYPENKPNLERLAAVLARFDVNCLFLTTSLFNLIIDTHPEMFRGVRQLLTGGEALSVSHIDRALHLLPDTTLINCYGPTEATTFTCAQTIPRPRPQTWASIPIGQPIAHTQVFILDPQGEPTPIGVAGELFIGGDGLAREYFNAPRRTAASFVPHPFARHPGERLYASGDLACWREDGSIAFLGRRDQQVKIRGFRIELGEIESVLASHPSVAQCVVVAHQSAAGEKRLVAYLVSKPEAAGLSNGSLLTFLKKHLPQYMLPADLVMLETLPLTPNGKVDRPKLSLLSGVQLQRDEEYCPPQTPTQELLASIWAEVLRLPKVGIHDDFFLLGGHSLLAMQVVSRIRDLFHINVPVKSIFEAPTVDQFSTVLINYEPTPCQVEKMAEIFKQVQAQTLVTK